MRTICAVYRAGYTDYDGLDTYAVMPQKHFPIESIEPFIFLNHHGHQVYPANNRGLPFGPHPHKGFETVTFIIEGELVHKDSTGYTSNIKTGGIQWMTAGKGIIHSETSSEEFIEKGGPLEILQLWVNLPAKFKNTPPAYIGLQQREIPILSFDEGRATASLVSGMFGPFKAPVQSPGNISLCSINFKKDGRLELSVPEEHTILFYVIKGKLAVNGQEVEMHELVDFNKDGETIAIKASEDALILFGHAAPNNEPIAAHGPFVMNTQEEIRQAFVEYQEGRLGTWRE